MIQQVLILIIFLAAVAYLGVMIYRSFQARSGGCASGCGKCGAVDFAKIEQQIKDKKL